MHPGWCICVPILPSIPLVLCYSAYYKASKIPDGFIIVLIWDMNGEKGIDDYYV